MRVGASRVHLPVGATRDETRLSPRCILLFQFLLPQLEQALCYVFNVHLASHLQPFRVILERFFARNHC